MSDRRLVTLPLEIPTEPPGESAGAEFSSDRRLRFLLWRTWDRLRPPALWIGMNPSYADEGRLDPTTARCRNWSRSWGYGGFVMANVLPVVSTDPNGAAAHPLVSAPLDHMQLLRNRLEIVLQAGRAGIVVCCWGSHRIVHRGGHARTIVDRLIRIGLRDKLHVLRLSKDGHPYHPLYLPNSAVPVAWDRPYGL